MVLYIIVENATVPPMVIITPSPTPPLKYITTISQIVNCQSINQISQSMHHKQLNNALCFYGSFIGLYLYSGDHLGPWASCYSRCRFSI